MARFELPPGRVSRAVAHKNVEEIWFITGGCGEMWRRREEMEENEFLEAGVCVAIPKGTAFQVRSSGSAPLTAIAVTMPPWPGNGEAYAVTGRWAPTSS
jgi:mannose-6-phosphate isomerase-like protein (cupin superfamily)